MKKIKIAIIIFISIVTLVVILPVLRFGPLADDRDINGFVGAWGALQLSLSGNDYAVLTSEPRQIMVYRNDFELVLENFFDNSIFDWVGGSFPGAAGYRNGIRYSVSRRVYTGRRYILTIDRG